MASKTSMSRRGFVALSTLTGALALGPRDLFGQQVYKELHQLNPGEFTWHPERQPHGPVAVIVSLDEQLTHVYRNGVRIAVSTCSTGKEGHRTPTGVFVVLQKDADHRSSTYNNAPMPNMNRLTWDGIALHAGNLPGYPASHGCVRLPHEFSALLFGITHVGTPVIIADEQHFPPDVAHPGLALSAYASVEYGQVLATLEDRKHPSDWKFEADQPVTSLIVSSHDRKAVLFENNVQIDESALQWDGRSLGTYVFVLNGPDETGQGLRWNVLSQGKSEIDINEILRSIDADADFSEAVRTYVHPGTVLIMTDLPLTPDQRSGRDFVIMTGA